MVPNQKDVPDWFFQEFLSDVTKRQKRQKAKQTKNIVSVFVFCLRCLVQSSVSFWLFVSFSPSNQNFFCLRCLVQSGVSPRFF